VVLVDLEVLAEISSSRAAQKFPLSRKIDETLRLSADVQQRLSKSTRGRLNSYFTHFMISLLKLFSTDRQLLDDRGSVIIRYLVIGYLTIHYLLSLGISLSLGILSLGISLSIVYRH